MFTPNSKNHYITNNLSESLNTWVMEARYLPCVDPIDIIRIKIKKNPQKKTICKMERCACSYDRQ